MRKIVLIFLCLGIMFTALNGQYVSDVSYPIDSLLQNDPADPSIQFAKSITADDMKTHLSILASDEFEGRETGQPGNDMASEYISKQFASLGLARRGLENSYFQKVSFTWTSWENAEIFVGDQRFKHLWDFLSFPGQNRDLNLKTDEVIFLGFGIDDPKYSDYKRKKKLAGKTIMIYQGEPIDKDGNSLLTGTKELSSWTGDIDRKLKVAKEYGVTEVLIMVENIQELLGQNRSKLLGPSVQLGDQTNSVSEFANSCYISTNIARMIMGDQINKVVKSRDRMMRKGKSKPVCLKTKLHIKQERRVNRLDGRNVLGYLEGTDKKDELIVVSAHYDHLGKRGEDIYNGADDNGSGTTTVLELAEAFDMAKEAGNGPRRSLLFLLVTGEEKGLLGSEYYSKYPVFPLENTICDVNVDMVGRVDAKYEENPNYIYVIGSDRLSSDLHRINEDVNNKYSQLVLDYTYNDEKDPNRYYYRSDHYNFAKNGIPAIFFFNGNHPDYHRTSDTVEKINFEKMEKVGRHIFHLTWDLANRDEAIRVDGEVVPN
jgi:hypothetical protein